MGVRFMLTGVQYVRKQNSSVTKHTSETTHWYQVLFTVVKGCQTQKTPHHSWFSYYHHQLNNLT